MVGKEGVPYLLLGGVLTCHLVMANSGQGLLGPLVKD